MPFHGPHYYFLKFLFELWFGVQIRLHRLDDEYTTNKRSQPTYVTRTVSINQLINQRYDTGQP